ncbi:MAG: hypothetical protein U0Y68_04455 [Blastocatellia bacterium]
MLLQVRTLPTRTAAGLSTSQAARAYLTLGRVHLESGEVQARWRPIKPVWRGRSKRACIVKPLLPTSRSA